MIVALRKVVLFSALMASSALATESGDSGFYTQGNLGYAMGVAPGGNFEQNTLSDAGVYSAALGYKFDKHFRVDFGIDYRDGYNNKFAVEHREAYPVINGRTVSVAYDTWTDTQTTKVRSWAAMASAYYDIAQINKITPYVMFGAGVARNTADSQGRNTYEDGIPDTYYFISRGTYINLAWKVGAGAQYSISENASLDFRYQYVDLGRFRTGNIHIYPSGEKEVLPNLEGRIRSNEFSLGLVYKY